jgi:hypothetical protein
MKEFLNRRTVAQAYPANLMNTVMRAFIVAALGIITLANSTHRASAQQFGGAAVPFLLIGPDSRAGGMGDAGTGLADDINAMHWNPGGLAFQYDRQITINYSRWLPQFNADLFYSHGAYSQYLDAVQGTVSGSFILMNLGQFIRTDINGRELGRFSSFEFAVNVGYSTRITEDLGFGFNLKYIQSDLGASTGNDGGGSGRSGALDLGLLWRPAKLNIAGLDLSDRLGLGFNLQNQGPAITYNRFSDPLPQKIRIGAAIDLIRDEYNELTFVADWSKLLVRRYNDSLNLGNFDRWPNSLFTGFGTPGSEIALGFEYWYDRTVALRGGYFAEPTQIGGRRFFTLGLGLHVFDIFYPNFSFILPIEQNHPLANTARFSLVINFNNGAALAGQKPAAN